MMNNVRIIYENLIAVIEGHACFLKTQTYNTETSDTASGVYIFHEMEKVFSNIIGYYQQSRDLLLPLTTSGKLMSSLEYKGR